MGWDTPGQGTGKSWLVSASLMTHILALFSLVSCLVCGLLLSSSFFYCFSSLCYPSRLDSFRPFCKLFFYSLPSLVQSISLSYCHSPLSSSLFIPCRGCCATFAGSESPPKAELTAHGTVLTEALGRDELTPLAHWLASCSFPSLQDFVGPTDFVLRFGCYRKWVLQTKAGL